eukprot:365467-Chlamydomonas_euryale.AAC.5
MQPPPILQQPSPFGPGSHHCGRRQQRQQRRQQLRHLHADRSARPARRPGPGAEPSAAPASVGCRGLWPPRRLHPDARAAPPLAGSVRQHAVLARTHIRTIGGPGA